MPNRGTGALAAEDPSCYRIDLLKETCSGLIPIDKHWNVISVIQTIRVGGSTRYVPQLRSRASPHSGPHAASLVRLLHQPPRFVTGRNSRNVSSWTPLAWDSVICDITAAHLVLPTSSTTSILYDSMRSYRR